MADSALTRRHPACGSELEHGPHEYTADYRPDGSVLGDRDTPGHCAGWTATEADLCVMIAEVHRMMLEQAPADGSRRFRLECHPLVKVGLHGLYLPEEPGDRLDRLHGADLTVVGGLGLGGWRLAEVLPPVASGTVRASI